ncbi:hypothetical protein FB563_3099 [Streptomyces puniciscabiei]|uniref:Uncharacterized protein n=1 Tax=Streptomyces puniciscabiei TaxID=164348 RepID=A0A542UG86_9ACTN|nr:hypothetical protein FB563_3099 [Streptomyces puniciscabiei]
MFSVSKASRIEREKQMSFHRIVPVWKTRKPAPVPAPHHKKRAPKKHEPKRPVGRK